MYAAGHQAAMNDVEVVGRKRESRPARQQSLAMRWPFSSPAIEVVDLDLEIVRQVFRYHVRANVDTKHLGDLSLGPMDAILTSDSRLGRQTRLLPNAAALDVG